MTSITLGKALRNAIEAEQASERFYRLLAESTKDEKAGGFLLSMADQEKQHAALLTRMSEQLQAGELPMRADDNVEVIETVPEWADLDDISFEQALEVALQAENNAALYYDALSSMTGGETADFFSQTARTEEEHAKKIQQIKKML